jgi:hypothetical protein
MLHFSSPATPSQAENLENHLLGIFYKHIPIAYGDQANI